MLGGRAPDVATLRSLFTVGRLTTVTGPPGAGKTAVATAAAVRAADSFRDGMRLVPLRELPDEALLAHAIMRTVGIPDQPSLPQAEALCDGLRDSRSLLVLDGCEHMLRGCAGLVRRLLRHCPPLHIAVTSREPLGLDGERVFFLAPGPDCAVPGPVRPREPPAPGKRETQASTREPPTCGTPCGIAAAGRSHRLCTAPERLLWARLSVFGADFTLTDAVQVCADRTLPASMIPGAARGLARRSLLRIRPGTGRYQLPEPVRDYGAMMLRELGEETDTRRRYRAWREVRS